MLLPVRVSISSVKQIMRATRAHAAAALEVYNNIYAIP